MTAAVADIEPETVQVSPALAPLDGIALRVANPADNDALLALTRATPMAGKIALRIDRDPDFFALLRARGEHIVFVATHQEKIVGCSSVAVYPAFIDGRIETIAHTGDLKVHPDFTGRRLALHLVSAIEHHLRSIGVDLSFNLIADGNQKAMTIAQGKHGTPIQTLLGRFFVDELLPSPFRPRASTCEIAGATPADLPALAEILNDFARARNFARPVALPDLERRLHSATTLVAHHAGRPVATLTLEDTQSLRRNVLIGLPRSYRAALAALRLLTIPMRGLHIPRLGEPLPMLHVRFMASAPGHEPALRPLLAEARALAFARRATVLSVALHERDPLRAVLAGIPRFTFISRAMCTSVITPNRVPTLVNPIPFEDFALV